MDDLRAKVDTDRLAEEHGSALYRFCRSLTFTREDGEDLFQDTFLKALERPQRLAADPRSFLFATALSLWRSRKRKYARRERIAPSEPLEDQAVPAEGPEEALLAQEEERLVREAVAALPEKYRLPLVLFYAMEMKVNDIARTLGLPPGTVKRRLFTAWELVEKGLTGNDGPT